MEDGGGIDRRFQGTAYTSSLASPAQSSHMRIGIIGSGKWGWSRAALGKERPQRDVHLLSDAGKAKGS